MIGERSDQMVLLPFISPGLARLACAEGRRRPSRRRVRAPPITTAIKISKSISLECDLEAGQDAGPAVKPR